MATKQDCGVELVGPMRQDYRRQAQEGQSFAAEQFRIDWEAQRAECPQGQVSSSWSPSVDRGKEVICGRRLRAPIVANARCARNVRTRAKRCGAR